MEANQRRHDRGVQTDDPESSAVLEGRQSGLVCLWEKNLHRRAGRRELPENGGEVLCLRQT